MKSKTRTTHAAPQPGRCVALEKEWHRAYNYRSANDEEGDANADRLLEVGRELSATPAETIPDILAKARLVAYFEVEQVLFDDPAIAASLLADLERLARPAGDDTAILALAEEYHALPKTFPEDATDEEVGVHAGRQMEIIEALPAMPAVTPEAIKFKLVALDYVSETFTAPELISRFVASITADLDRMTGGTS